MVTDLFLFCTYLFFPYLCQNVSVMASPTLKDLRTTYRVLSHIDADVPKELLIDIAERIRRKESIKLSNRIARMTEEDLIHFQDIQHHRIRIDLPDGRIIQEKTNDMTFIVALKEAGPAKIFLLGITVKKKPLIVNLPEDRKQLVGHKYLVPGYFVIRGIKSAERLKLLERIDNALQLDWKIQLI